MTLSARIQSTVFTAFSTACAALLSACAAPISQGGDAAQTTRQVSAIAKESLQFLDLAGFDRDLAASLGAPLVKVDVSFLDNVKPSALPERLQRWMASVEGGGGRVSVTPPKTELQGRSLFAVVSAATTVWSASKMAASLAESAQYRAARAYNAEILLKRDASGDSVVDKIIFTKR